MTDTLVVTEERTELPILTSEDVASTAKQALDEARRVVAEIESIPLDAATTENVFDAWDRAAIVLEDAFGPISILNSVHPDKAVRDAGDDALVAERSEEHTSELQSRRDLVCRLLLEKKKARVSSPWRGHFPARGSSPATRCPRGGSSPRRRHRAGARTARAACRDGTDGTLRTTSAFRFWTWSPIFSFIATATTGIYTLSLHDALPI